MTFEEHARALEARYIDEDIDEDALDWHERNLWNAACDECAKVAPGRLEGSSLRSFGAEIASEIEKLKVEVGDER